MIFRNFAEYDKEIILSVLIKIGHHQPNKSEDQRNKNSDKKRDKPLCNMEKKP